ncbi:hypothetical protein B9Q13_04715, partial [Candidatus Marsarchaeota G2 archaeon ECH_B_SAG-G16]
MSEKSTQFVESLEVARKSYRFYSLQKLEKEGIGKVSKLPLSLRVVLESLVRNFDGFSITEEDIATLANWNAKNPAEKEIPFKVSRVLMQDFTGVPCIVDLAAMRDVVKQNGLDPKLINPVVPI